MEDLQNTLAWPLCSQSFQDGLSVLLDLEPKLSLNHLFPKVLEQLGIREEVFTCWAHLDFNASILKTGFGGKIPQM